MNAKIKENETIKKQALEEYSLAWKKYLLVKEENETIKKQAWKAYSLIIKEN